MAKGGDGGLSDWERQAVRERAAELKAQARVGKKDEKAEGERMVREAIAAMPEPDRKMAAQLHTLVGECAPALVPKTWYGMPAYARNGQVICFFQGGYKFKARYATLGFSDKARLDEGAMWPTGFAIREWNTKVEAAVRELLARALRN